MFKMIAIAAVAGGAIYLAGAPANAASPTQGINNDTVKVAVADDLSARRKRYRRAVRTYTYPGPTPYGYYGPVYYERPYARPAPFLFGFPSYW